MEVPWEFLVELSSRSLRASCCSWNADSRLEFYQRVVQVECRDRGDFLTNSDFEFLPACGEMLDCGYLVDFLSNSHLEFYRPFVTNGMRCLCQLFAESFSRILPTNCHRWIAERRGSHE